jgi:pimeloyl-ACP methyl ester carboxylesterase
MDSHRMPAEKRIEVSGIGTRYWEVEGQAPEHPVVFVHGNPHSADSWLPFLEKLEGTRRGLAPDLVGWGKADKPGDFSYTVESLAWFVERFIDELSIERFDLVVHDWGSVGLIAASWRPECVGRIAIVNAVPLTSEYRWHWAARAWRTPVLGELMLATINRFATHQIMRQATPRPGSLPEVVDEIHRYLDRGTKRAILQLYRDADPEKLEPLGRGLANLSCPVLVLWGDADPYIQSRFADWFAEALGGETRVEHLPDAGHWAWIDRPDVIDETVDFLAAVAGE